MTTKSNHHDWWRGAVMYQIYPRSFMDTNFDGVGDLKGITSKLDYVASLGVDGIWISPFFKSPMKDFGYDVSDYAAVDPLFGAMEDFDELLKAAHRLGLKVLVDMVLSHTSKEHPWFKESRRDRNSPKGDWYVWADPKPDGRPPNNWRSIFGGEAWTFDTHRRQYYMHNFLPDQPDLNFHNPDVQDAMLNACRFWLDKGVDGIRLDVINFIFHDKKLRNNPAKDPRKEGFSSQFEKPDPYSMQHHVYDKSRPEALKFARKFRAMMNEYPGTMTLAEIGDDNEIKRAAEYTAGDKRYHTAYNFSLMTGKDITATKIRTAVEGFMAEPTHGWPSWAFSNHDVIRAVSRWGEAFKGKQQEAFAKILLASLTSLRGTPFIYQGEELALTEGKIPFEKLQDPWGKYLWPEWQGRDGCRTPMPWKNLENGGFTAADEAWLPMPPEHLPRAVELQEQDEDSPLSFARAFLHWRKQQPALVKGDIVFHDSGDDNLLCFFRRSAGQTLFCAFNLAAQPAELSIPGEMQKQSLFENGGQTGSYKNGVVELPPFGFYFSPVL